MEEGKLVIITNSVPIFPICRELFQNFVYCPLHCNNKLNQVMNHSCFTAFPNDLDLCKLLKNVL